MPIILSRKTGGGGAPSGSAGGDLSGTYPNPTISAQGSADGFALISDGAGGTAFERPPGFQLAYVEDASDTTISATVEATPQNLLSAGAVVFDGATRVRIEFWYSRVDVPNGASCIFNLWDDTTTDLGRVGYSANTAGGTVGQTVYGSRFLTPSAASHTYRIRAWRVTANATTVGASPAVPGFIRITVAPS